MSQKLWLITEQTPNSEEACYPATADDVRLVLDFLEATSEEQRDFVCRITRLMTRQKTLPRNHRRMIPCRRAKSLFVLMPWQLVAWLIRVLESPTKTRTEVQDRLKAWLSRPCEAASRHEETKHVVAQPEFVG